MGPFFHNGFSLMEGATKRMKIGKEEILWIVKVWKNLWKYLKKVGPASRKRTFFFVWHRVPNNAHVIELGSDHVHYKIWQDVIPFRAFLEVPSGLKPNKDGQGSNGYWAGTRLLGHLVGQVPTPAVPILHVKLELELEPWYNF